MLSSLFVVAPSWVRLVAEWIQWFGLGAEGVPDIPKGKGSVEDIVSYHKDVQRELDVQQLKVASKAKDLLGARARRRSNSFQIGTKSPSDTKLDRYVYLVDTHENNWWQSSVSLEYGHWAKGFISKPVWVPGMWIIHDAAGLPHKK